MLRNKDLQEKYTFLNEYTNPLKKSERKIVGRQDEMNRILATFKNPELCNVILLAEAGSGKALLNSTLIPVNDSRGYVEIGDIKVGDKVFDEEGHECVVEGVFPQGEKDVYKVNLKGNKEVYCCIDHLWTVRYKHNKDNLITFTTKDLIKEMKHGKMLYIPKAKPIERGDRSNFNPWLVGVFLQEVCLADLEAELCLTTNNTSLVERVAKDLDATYVKANKCFYFTKDGKNLKVSDFKAYIEGYGLDTSKYFCEVDKREIPSGYIVNSMDVRLKLLQGIMDVRGCIRFNNSLMVSLYVATESLVLSLNELFSSLGILTSYSRVCVSSNRNFEIRLSMMDEDKAEVFSLDERVSFIDTIVSSKKKQSNKNFRYDDILIESIEKLDRVEEMTCIKVSSPNSLFLCTKNHIVTHNTMLVQGTMEKDKDREYVEVDLSKMITNLKNENEMASRLKQLFDEAARYGKEEGKELVLFIDEFHQIVQLSPAAVEALKPLLADSGTRGIRVVAATTYIEFRQFVSPNQPLVERLKRINLQQPDKEMTVQILKGMAVKYGIDNLITSDKIFELIYDYTNRYIPSNSQPRKSIIMLDSMTGWHRLTGEPLDAKLLAKVIYETEGVNVNFNVDAKTIKQKLGQRVFAQELALRILEQRLQVCVADLNDKTKPMSSFLFTGSSGVGKMASNDVLVPVLPRKNIKNLNEYWKRHGDLEVGDIVFARDGSPTKVTGVYKHKDIPMYKVTFTDGRSVDVGGPHLWAVYTAKQKTLMAKGSKLTPRIMSTDELLSEGLRTKVIEDKNGRVKKGKLKYYIPMNHAVQWKERDYKVHPYVIGAFIANGCMTLPPLTLSSDDRDVVDLVAKLLNSPSVEKSKTSYNWYFNLPKDFGPTKYNRRRYQTKEVLGDIPELYNVKSGDRRIPPAYMHGSIEQRWELVRGLFDCDGSVDDSDRCRVTYSTYSKGLAEDVRKLLLSLGVSSTITCFHRVRKDRGIENDEYRVTVKSTFEEKLRFFNLQRKKDVINKWIQKDQRVRIKTFDLLGIESIEYIGNEDAQCIMVDNDEHLYQLGDFIVTHNTEAVKALSEVLFNDARNFLRFDMSEFSNPDSLDRFKKELTARVWERPYSVILLDEIEKSCKEVTRLLLQVLDDGRLTDENNRVVSFLNSYIVLTTNAASEVYKTIAQYGASDTGDGSEVLKFRKLIETSIRETTEGRFPAEILGRLDEIVPFQPLSLKTIEKIIKNKYLKLKKEVYEKHGVEIRGDQKVINYLVLDSLDTDSDSGGARNAIRKFDSEVTTALSRTINEYPDEKLLRIKVVGELSSDNKYKLKSEGKIEILRFNK